jgi:hypothetical protein
MRSWLTVDNRHSPLEELDRLGVPITFPGIGTVVNVIAVLLGSSVGLLLGARLPHGLGTLSPTLSGWSPY